MASAHGGDALPSWLKTAVQFNTSGIGSDTNTAAGTGAQTSSRSKNHSEFGAVCTSVSRSEARRLKMSMAGDASDGADAEPPAPCTASIACGT